MSKPVLFQPSSCRFAGRSVASLVAMMLLFANSPTWSQAQVVVAPAQASAVAQELRLSGTLTPERSARLSPRVDGLVDAVLVDAGDRVAAGDALLRLDATLADAVRRGSDAEVKRARASRDEAKRRADEARRLVPERHLPQTELDARLAALAEADAALAVALAGALEQAELVRRHGLNAPFAGVITVKLTEAGEWVSRGDAVLELVSLDAVRLDVQAPQEVFASLRDDTSVEIVPDARPDQVLPARVAARVPVGGGAGARTFLVRVVAQNTDALLFPGTSATARFRLAGSQATAVQVSRDALLRHPDGGYSVFVVEPGGDGMLARRRQVQLGRDSGESVEVLDGVRAGEQVVVRGNEALSDGDAVRIVEPQG